MEQVFVNSYPHMRKRILDEVMEILVEKPNLLALYYFEYA